MKYILTSILGILLSSATLASSSHPAFFHIFNATNFNSVAFVHNISTSNLGPGQSLAIKWKDLTELCHGTSASANDPCSFEVYASNNSNPTQIDVGTVAFYLNDGNVFYKVTTPSAKNYGLKIVANAPGNMTLASVAKKS